MPTQQDIAIAAGVSQSTVSLVLSPSPRLPISAEVRERVLDACRRLGYEGDARGRRGQIGLLAVSGVPEAAVLYARLERGLSEGAKRTGCVILRRPVAAGETATEILSNLNCDGLVAHARMPDAVVRQLAGKLPMVLVNRQEPCRHCDRVRCDDAGAVAELVRRLHALGHLRIAFLGQLAGPFGSRLPGARDLPIGNQVVTMRLSGYLAGLAELGLPLDESLVGTTNKDPHPAAGDWSGREVARLLALPEPPTALIAANDVLARAAIAACRASGRSVPGDISIAGFDDAAEGDDGLTTIDADLRQQGRIAYDLLAARIDGSRAGPPATVLVPGNVRMRSTTAPRHGGER